MKQMIGTIVDNYKVEMFEAEFKAAGIEIISITPFMKGILLIKVFSEQRLVKPIVDKITQHFIDEYKRKN